MERSLVLVKPDGVQRGLIGEVITRLENRGCALWLRNSCRLARSWQNGIMPFTRETIFDGLIAFITSSPVMAMVWTGPDAIVAIRQTMGNTRGTDADPGTIRSDYAIQNQKNLTHASDSPENAEAEIALWFTPEELVDWKRCTEDWSF